MSLAQRLNELAQANSDGLLSDDEYRLLRQSAFEQHANPSLVPIERPVVPTVPTRHGITPKSPSRGKSPKEQLKEEQPLKLSVTNIFRRATGKYSPVVPRSEHTLPASPVAPASGENSPSGPRRGLIPRLFLRKPSEPAPLRITPSQSHPNMRSPVSPQSPARSPPRPSYVTPKVTRRPTSSHTQVNTAFDDHSLVTSQDIREAILALENELYGLVDAFNNLEQTAVRRIKKRTARRLPATTPDSVDVLLEGREWREHRMISSPSTPAFDSRARAHRYHRPLEPLADGQSVYSNRSDKTNFSQSRSISNLSQQQPPPSSPLSSHFRIPSSSLQRKGSVSSVSSRGTSLLSSSRNALSPGSHHSRQSSTQLPLQSVTQPPFVEDDEAIELEEDEAGADQLSELHEIQERRNEVITRYTQRIEYLKAKQKGAELHERLLRK